MNPPYERMRSLGRIHTLILKQLKKKIQPGVEVWELEEYFQELAQRYNVKSACIGKVTQTNGKKTKPYPTNLCVSLNDEAIHVYPTRNKRIMPGDLVTVDLVLTDGQVFTDAAFTTIAGDSTKAPLLRKKLLECAYKALQAGLAVVKKGVHVGTIGAAIQKVVKEYGFSVLTDYGGHGIGWNMWEDIFIPNFGPAHIGPKLQAGMYIAIEPLILTGNKGIIQKDDWITVTADGSDFAQVEATVMVTETGYKLITDII